jgi:tetratricopeptide (TPR) repeat protein
MNATLRACGAALLVGLLAFALFRPAEHGEFVWDDMGLLGANNQSVDEWSDAIAGFRRPVLANLGVGYYRPILTATFVADFQRAGADPAAFHQTNVALHAVNAALVCVLLWLLTRVLWASVVGALLFAVHPLQGQAVALVLGRNDLLLIPPVVAMLIADELAERGGRRLAGGVVMVACYAIALWTKETAIVVPALIPLTDVLWRGRPLRALGRRLPLLAAMAAVTVAYFAVRVVAIGAYVGGEQYGTTDLVGRVTLAIATLGYYVRGLVVPWGFAPAPYYAALVDPRRGPFWIGVAFAILGIVATVACLRRRPHVAYGLAFFLVTVSPVLGLAATMKVAMLEHRTYLPMLGIAIAAAALATRVRRATVAMGVACVVLAALAAVTATRLPSYWTALSLWGMAVANVPASDYARNNYAAALMDASRTPEAIEQLNEAIRLNPEYDRARYNLAACLEFMGRRPEAIEQLRAITARRSRDTAVWNRLGLMLGRENQAAAARDAFARALEIAPDDPLLVRNYADATARLQEWDEAVRAYRHLVEVQPNEAESWRKLGVALSSQGKTDEAVTAFRRAVAIGPATGRMYVDLAAALYRLGRWPEAAAEAHRGRELGAVDPALWRALQDTGALTD